MFQVLLNPAAEHWIEEQRRVEIAPDEVGIALDETSGKVRIIPPQEYTDHVQCGSGGSVAT